MKPSVKKTSIGLLLLVVAVVAGAYAMYKVRSERMLRREIESAQAALVRRDFREALSHLKAYLDERPDDTAIQLLAAQTARRQGDFEEARRRLRVHEEQGGPKPERRREQKLLAIQQGDVSQGDILLDQCLTESPTDETPLMLEVVIEQKLKLLEETYNSGKTLLEGPGGQDRARIEKALELWFRLCSGQADRVQGLIWRGKLQLLLNQEEAVAAFRQSLEIDPANLDARLQLGLALADFDSREAAWHLQILHERDPENRKASIFLAYFLRSLGKLGEAQRLLDEVLAVEPNHLTALLERSKTAMDAGRPREAEEFLRRALTRSPDDSFVHLALSRCLLLTGKEEEAKRHEQRYNEIESARTKEQLTREESERAWRKRMAKN